MIIQILVDNPRSWIVPYAEDLVEQLQQRAHSVNLIHNQEDVESGDILCLLSCEKIFTKLNLNKSNIVVHESLLPKGKGWSPLTWQIIEGKNRVPITLFEATESVDAGEIYLQDFIEYDGHELLEEIKYSQGQKTNELILRYIDNYSTIKGKAQKGDSTFYKRRKPQDSQIDMSKSLNDQFNLLRVCDNRRYPAFFEKDGYKYIIKITKE